jgi:glutathione S-transferase
MQTQIISALQQLETLATASPPWLGGACAGPSVIDFYLAALLRWPALYPADTNRDWYDLQRFPALFALCARLETLPCTHALQMAEGLGDTPFTAPRRPTPPEGSAL